MTKEFVDCQAAGDDGATAAALLQVPHVQVHIGTQRSRSVESPAIDTTPVAASYLEVPKRFQRRRSSSAKSAMYCVHCLCMDEYERYCDLVPPAEPVRGGDSDASLSDDDDDETDDSEHIDHSYSASQYLTIPLIVPQCNINISLTSTDAFALPTTAVAAGGDDADDSFLAGADPTCDRIGAPADGDASMAVPQRSRRRSISRQEAIFVEPTGSSLENLDSVKPADGHGPRMQRNTEHSSVASNDSSDYVQDFYLTVPEADLRRDRAASVDSSFSKVSSNGVTEELQPQIDGFLAIPTNAVRSRSVDIVLPTDEQARYKALAMAGPATSKRYV